MKSLRELLAYYEGCLIGARATSELSFGSIPGAIVTEDATRLLDSAFLYDADRLAKASLASFLACSHLRAGGHSTWGEISLYYARFHSVSAMARLVGITSDNKWLLIRSNEERREYKRMKKNTKEANEVGCGGGSHREVWRIFSRYFQDWAKEEVPGQDASGLGEDPIFIDRTAWYEAAIEERNEANYLQRNAGLFFPETDFSKLHRHIVEDAKSLGSWNWLRTDASPGGSEEPPEAWFFKEMMTWDLIKFVIMALVKSQGQRLLEDYIWVVHNLDAYHELTEHLKIDLLDVCTDN